MLLTPLGKCKTTQLQASQALATPPTYLQQPLLYTHGRGGVGTAFVRRRPLAPERGPLASSACVGRACWAACRAAPCAGGIRAALRADGSRLMASSLWCRNSKQSTAACAAGGPVPACASAGGGALGARGDGRCGTCKRVPHLLIQSEDPGCSWTARATTSSSDIGYHPTGCCAGGPGCWTTARGCKTDCEESLSVQESIAAR